MVCVSDGLCVCSFVSLVVLCVFRLLRFVYYNTDSAAAASGLRQNFLGRQPRACGAVCRPPAPTPLPTTYFPLFL